MTQQQILDAAEQEFSRHGLNGARMNAIAERAKRVFEKFFEVKFYANRLTIIRIMAR
jgi:3-methyladenine DNA glycosylase/8-oxoguanine DNA glycosylase